MGSALKPFWRYFGGKWRAAPHYPKPLLDTIVEPFAGAAGYSLRYPERKVILVEKYAVIAEIWRYLIGVKESEVRAIPCVDAVGDLPPWVPQPARDLVGFTLNDAVVAPCKTLSAGLRSLRDKGPSGAIYGWSERARERVASQVGAIRHWRVIEGDYSDAPNCAATWFIDPPYHRSGTHYVHGSRSIDFAQLGVWCRTREGQPIVCEQAGADWLPFAPFRSIKASDMNRTTAGVSHEVIWTGDKASEVAA